jgi:hypothetical protein
MLQEALHCGCVDLDGSAGCWNLDLIAPSSGLTRRPARAEQDHGGSGEG